MNRDLCLIIKQNALKTRTFEANKAIWSEFNNKTWHHVGVFKSINGNAFLVFQILGFMDVKFIF